MSAVKAVEEKKVIKPKSPDKSRRPEAAGGPSAAASQAGPLNPRRVLALQAMVGNAAVQRLLAQESRPVLQRDTAEEVEEDDTA